MKKNILWILLFLAISTFATKLFYSYKITLAKKILPEIDYIVVEKSNRLIKLYSQGQLIRQYKIALGSNPLGHKKQEGDGKTPEGEYTILYKNPKSKYHLSLKISYPNNKDKENAEKTGVNPGDHIMIHGTGIGGNIALLEKYIFQKDWTKGCIAVTNQEIEEIYPSVAVGTQINIRP